MTKKSVKKKTTSHKVKRYPENYFLNQWMALGIPLGLPVGLALGNIALGPAIGVALGVGIGSIIEKKKNPNPIPLSKEVKSRQRKFGIAAIILGIIIAIIATIMYFN